MNSPIAIVNNGNLDFYDNDASTYTVNTRAEAMNLLDQILNDNPDLEGDLLPPIVKALQAKIKAADGIIISTPEYVFSLPGNLKNFLEWHVSTTLFSGKPVALIVAAASGKKAMESLDLVMSTITVGAIPDDLKLLLQGIGGKIDQEGLISDEVLKTKITQLISAFQQIL